MYVLIFEYANFIIALRNEKGRLSFYKLMYTTDNVFIHLVTYKVTIKVY